MSFFGRLALLFVGVPILELLLLIQMGKWIGLGPTLVLILLTGFAGAALARLEGIRTLWSIRGELARGRLPGRALLDGMAILVGGAFLLTPGVLTDVVGLACLFPPTRRLILARVRKGLEQRLREGAIQVTYVSGFPDGGVSGGGPKENEAPSGEIVVEPRRVDRG